MASKITSVALALFATTTLATETVEPLSIQVPLTKTVSGRQMTHEESLTMRKQRLINAKVMEKQRGGYLNSAMQWLGLAQATIVENPMTVLNWYDEIYTFQISVDETPTTMQATLDTAMGHTVIETTDCTDCGPWRLNTGLGQGGLAVGTTAVTGNLSYSAYKGVSGTATFCIFQASAYANAPTSGNIASMPCIPTMKMHFAKEVTDPNLKATAHLGMALGGGKDRYGNQPAAADLIMNQFVTASRLTTTSKRFGIGLQTDDGKGNDAATSKNFMTFGNVSGKFTATKAAMSIQFQDNEFYWKTSLNGVWFGSQENSKYGLEDASITLETGLQCLYVPSNQYSFIYDKVTAYSTGYWTTPAGETIMDCGDKTIIKNISLLMNDKWVQISAQDFLIPLRTGSNGKEVSTGMCKLCIKLSSDDDWHVGSSALISYYAEFDLEQRTLRLEPQVGSQKPDVTSGSKPDIVLGDSIWTILILSLANVFVITAFVLLCLAVYFDTNVVFDDDTSLDDTQEDQAFVPDEANQVEQEEEFEVEEAEEEEPVPEQDEDTVTIEFVKKAKVGASELEGLLQSALAKKRAPSTTLITLV